MNWLERQKKVRTEGGIKIKKNISGRAGGRAATDFGRKKFYLLGFS